MMGTKIRSFSPLPHHLSLEDLVPEDNFYRRLEGRRTWPMAAGGSDCGKGCWWRSSARRIPANPRC